MKKIAIILPLAIVLLSSISFAGNGKPAIGSDQDLSSALNNFNTITNCFSNQNSAAGSEENNPGTLSRRYFYPAHSLNVLKKALYANGTYNDKSRYNHASVEQNKINPNQYYPSV